jgi:hypothetical protein
VRMAAPAITPRMCASVGMPSRYERSN